MQDRRAERTHVVDPPVYDDADARTERLVDARSERVVNRDPDAAVVRSPSGAAVDEMHTTAYDPYEDRRHASHRLVQAIWLLFGIVEGLLAIRFVLRLLGANENAGFADLIYSASAPFVAPFNDLFANPASGGSVLELTTLTAIVVYMLLGWLIAKVIWLLAGESRSETRTVASSTRARMD